MGCEGREEGAEGFSVSSSHFQPFLPPSGPTWGVGAVGAGGDNTLGMLKGPGARLGMGSGRGRGLSPHRSLLCSRTSISSLTGLVYVLWRAASFHGPLLQRPPCYLPQLGAPQPAPLPALFLSPSCCCCEVVILWVCVAGMKPTARLGWSCFGSKAFTHPGEQMAA